jgi:hypothetical protein
MATFSKAILSGSTNGRAVLVDTTSSNTCVVHTGSTNTSVTHEVWLYAQNTDTSDRKLTIEFGGVTSPNDLIEQTVAAESGLVLVVPGLLLTGNSTTAPRITAFAASANVVTLHGFVNVIA